MASTDTSKQCSITNNSGKDITVILAVPPGETSNSLAVSSAGGSLEMLKTTAGDTIIKNGASGVVTLDHNFQEGSGAPGYMQNYNLVICDSTWLYPLANLQVEQQVSNGSSGFKPQTVTADDLSEMKTAITLYQTLAAFPDSELSKNYITALQDAKNAALALADGSPDSAQKVAAMISEKMSAFFSASQEYKNVRLEDMVAISTYYNNLPFVWSQYKDSITYYLYGSDGTTSVFAGTLSLNKSGNIDITKTNGSYTCLFTPAANPTDLQSTSVDASKAATLYYENGLFLNDPKAANPAIALKGSFLVKRLFTNDPDDNGIVLIVTGTVNGKLCIGFDTAQKTTPPVQQVLTATESTPDLVIKYWDRLTHPKTLKDWVISIATLVGAVALIPATAFMIYNIYRVVKFKIQQKETLSKKVIDQSLNEENQAVKKDGIKWGGNDEEDLAAYYNLTVEQVMEITEAASLSQAVSGTFYVQRLYVNELLKYSSVMSAEEVSTLQTLLTSMHDSSMAASKAVDNSIYEHPELLAERKELLRGEVANISKYQETFEKLYTKVENKISQDSKEEIEEVMGTAKQYATNLKESFEKDAEEEMEAHPKVSEEIGPFGY